MPVWSWLSQLYREEIAEAGKQPVFLLLLGMIVGFVVIRVSTRLIRARTRWWPGNLLLGGVHLHHELFGVVTMIVAGVLAFAVPPTSPWRDLLAFAFGIGTGLVLDEFALLLHLRDVYWHQEGRTSIDAVIVAVTLTGMVLLGAAPFDLTQATEESDGGGRWGAVALVLLNFGLTVVTALKGKYWVALLSVPLWGLGIIGAIRLGRPDSPWGRRRYPENSAKRARAQRRAERWTGASSGSPTQWPVRRTGRSERDWPQLPATGCLSTTFSFSGGVLRGSLR